MSQRRFNGLGACTVIAAALTLATAAPTLGQTAAPAGGFKTPWGDPDLQGVWSNATTTPLQRPAKWAGRERLTKEEIAEINRVTEVATDARAERGTPADVGGAYNGFWWDRGFSDGRTSLIFDPPDGRIPPRTSAGEKRWAEENRRERSNEGGQGDGEFAGPEDLALYTRCIIRAPLPRTSTGYNNNYQIVQAPGYVAILQEQMHETRMIPLSGRPHLNGKVRQWLGDSRGRWEGDTLVVETTNFLEFPGMSFQGATKDMKLTERFKRVDKDTIEYTFTVEDPNTWSRPWSAMIAYRNLGGNGDNLYQYACHEDNYGMYGILAGARFKEKSEAAKKGTAPGR